MRANTKRRQGAGAPREQGSTVIVALIFTFVLLTMGGALVNYVVQEYKATHVSQESAAALSTAEAGLEKAMHILQSAPKLTSGSYSAYDAKLGEGFTGCDMSATVDSNGNATGFTKTGTPVEYALSTDVPGEAGTFAVDVEVLNPTAANSRRKLVVDGYFPDKATCLAGKGVHRQVVAWIRRGAWGFPNAAILGRDDVMLGNLNSGPVTVTYDGSTYGPSGVANLANVVSTDGDINAHSMGTTIDGRAVAGGTGGTVSNKITASAGEVEGISLDPAAQQEIQKYRNLWPPKETTDTWFAQWKSDAQQIGVRTAGQYGPGAILPAGYYGGDVVLGNNVKTGTGSITIDKSAGNIVFVDGNLCIQSVKLINPGCMFVVTGDITLQGNGSYCIEGEPYGYGLIANGSITLQGTPDGTGAEVGIGFVYSVNGAVTLQGDAMMVGAIIAGGVDPKTGESVHVQTSSKGGLKYPENLLSKQNFLPGTPVIIAWQEK